MNGDIRRVLKAPTKPLLDFTSLQFSGGGYYVSDKEDGIRAITHPRYGLVSQKLLEIPNLWVCNMLNLRCPRYLDGELVAIDCEGNTADFNDTQSAIMTESGQPAFEFRVFDCFENQYIPYSERYKRVRELLKPMKHDCSVQPLAQVWCTSAAEIAEEERSALERGKEGVMIRSPDGWYKEGRSTLAEEFLLKVKRFVDDEAVVIAIEEELANCNLATRDAGGLQKRSKHLAGMVGKKRVGVLICRWRGKTLRIASGMTDLQKQWWWDRPCDIVAKRITFKYQAHGMKVLPRAPIFKGVRYD